MAAFGKAVKHHCAFEESRNGFRFQIARNERKPTIIIGGGGAGHSLFEYAEHRSSKSVACG